MRLSRRDKEVLKHYGISYLLESEVMAQVDANNMLHNVDGCHIDDAGVTYIDVGMIDQPCCGCLGTALSVQRIRTLVDRLTPLYRHLQVPVVPYDTYNKLIAAERKVEQMNSALLDVTVPWFFPGESWDDLFHEAWADLRKHIQKIEQMIISDFPVVCHEFGVANPLSDTSPAAVELQGESIANQMPENSYTKEFKQDRYAFILWHWLELIMEGVPAKDRHRKTMKMVGAAFMGPNRRRDLPEEASEVAATLKHVSGLIHQLEAELAENIVKGPETFLVADEILPNYNMRRILAQKYVILEEGRTQLLEVPRSALRVFAGADEPSWWTPMPVDEKIREIAVKMWDSDPLSVLFSPVNLVNLAEAVLN